MRDFYEMKHTKPMASPHYDNMRSEQEFTFKSLAVLEGSPCFSTVRMRCRRSLFSFSSLSNSFWYFCWIQIPISDDAFSMNGESIIPAFPTSCSVFSGVFPIAEHSHNIHNISGTQGQTHRWTDRCYTDSDRKKIITNKQHKHSLASCSPTEVLFALDSASATITICTSANQFFNSIIARQATETHMIVLPLHHFHPCYHLSGKIQTTH